MHASECLFKVNYYPKVVVLNFITQTIVRFATGGPSVVHFLPEWYTYCWSTGGPQAAK